MTDNVFVISNSSGHMLNAGNFSLLSTCKEPGQNPPGWKRPLRLKAPLVMDHIDPSPWFTGEKTKVGRRNQEQQENNH
jgi:hypothetical protein